MLDLLQNNATSTQGRLVGSGIWEFTMLRTSINTEWKLTVNSENWHRIWLAPYISLFPCCKLIFSRYLPLPCSIWSASALSIYFLHSSTKLWTRGTAGPPNSSRMQPRIPSLVYATFWVLKSTELRLQFSLAWSLSRSPDAASLAGPGRI